LDYFPEHPAEKIILGKNPETALSRLPALAAQRLVVILASGDPNFFGIGALALKVLGAAAVVFHPNLTAVQAGAARLKITWHDAALVSLHGRGWEELAGALARARKIFVYTDAEHTPAAIARFLLDRGLADARLAVLEDVGRPTERLGWHSLEEAAGAAFAPLNTVLIVRPAPPAEPLHLGLPEGSLEHEGGLITKSEIRAVALAKLQLMPGHLLWDVGAGSGSVGLEAGLLLPGGSVYAVEQDRQRCARIAANRAKFGAAHLVVVCGKAPDCLAALPDPHRVFVGGGGRDLPGILGVCLDRLQPGGRLVVAAARLKTLETARTALAAAGWRQDIVQLQVSRSQPLAQDLFLKALNPVWLVSGWQE